MQASTTDGGEAEPLADLGFDMPRARWRRLFTDLAASRMESLADVYDAASDRLYGLALWITGDREEAADVVSETFVRLAEQGPRLAAVREPRSWLLTVARRLAVDVVRRRTRRPSDRLETAALVVAVHADPERTGDAVRASALLAELPTAQREAVYLRHYADCTFAAIGRITGVSMFTAASRYRLAIRRLRRLMELEP